jgi:hypothetical protein
MMVSEVVDAAANNPALKAQLENDPIGTLSALPLQSDVWIYRVVVGALGFVAITAIVGGLVLAAYGKTTPEGVIALGSTALGAIAGLLAPSPGRGSR